MSIVLLVYLASIVDSIKNLGGFLMFATPLVFLASLWVISFDNIGKREVDKSKLKYVKTMIATLFIGIFLNTFTPTEKTLYLMAGASIAQDIANSPKTAATLDKVYKIVDKKLEEQLEGVSKNVNKRVDVSDKEVKK